MQNRKEFATKQLVACLFTDIGHSTRLAQQLRENYPEFLERHRDVIRQAVARHNGREMDVTGDGSFLTFAQTIAAVRAAADIQRIFHAESWAAGSGLKVRMRIHTGVALCSTHGCTGVEVHYASRICDVAHGGQVLVSNASRELLAGTLNDSLSLTDLGSFVLKDFTASIRLHQLNIPGTTRHFPRPRIDPVNKRVAVMPLANLSDDPGQEYLCDGMTEEIIMSLGKVPGLRVVSRSSVYAIRGAGLDVRQIGRKLNATSVVEGTVRQKDGNVRIAVELVDAESGLNIWSATYNSPKEQFFTRMRRL